MWTVRNEKFYTGKSKEKRSTKNRIKVEKKTVILKKEERQLLDCPPYLHPSESILADMTVYYIATGLFMAIERQLFLYIKLLTYLFYVRGF
jgi:hypothetical protein